MAEFSFKGLDEVSMSLRRFAELPESVKDEMLEAQADVVLQAQRREAEELGRYSRYGTEDGNFRNTSKTNHLPGQIHSYSTGDTAKSLKKAKPKNFKGLKTIRIYFAGSRRRGKKTITKNSEIAFLNEFGTRTINARHFIWVANQESEKATTQAAKAVLDKWTKLNNL